MSPNFWYGANPNAANVRCVSHSCTAATIYQHLHRPHHLHSWVCMQLCIISYVIIIVQLWIYLGVIKLNSSTNKRRKHVIVTSHSLPAPLFQVGSEFTLVLGEVFQLVDRVGNDSVLSWFPVGGANFSIFIGMLEGLHQTECFVN